MKQARTILPTYSADAFGVCSALYELGGMVVMHDASGCNSTYSTHDEPRWYHSDSLVYVSGLTEMDAILGNDERLKNDMLAAIRELHPAFAAIVGTPIPMMTGFHYEAVAEEIEEDSGIPCFGFPTNGMRSYLCGASEALAVFAEYLTKPLVEKEKRTINILGATPLDFSLSGTVFSIRRILSENHWRVLGCWAMGSSLDDLSQAGRAQVNLVISGTGMKTAEVLQKKFGTPYVVGIPIGKAFTGKILECLEATAKDGRDRIAFSENIAKDGRDRIAFSENISKDGRNRISFSGSTPEDDSQLFIIGESVISRSLAAAVKEEYGIMPKVIYPLEELPELRGILSSSDIHAVEEEEIQRACEGAELVIADPLYRPILPKSCEFIPLPHEAFSGRMFRKEIPDLTDVISELRGF